MRKKVSICLERVTKPQCEPLSPEGESLEQWWFFPGMASLPKSPPRANWRLIQEVTKKPRQTTKGLQASLASVNNTVKVPHSIHPSCCVFSFHPPGQGSQLQPPSSLSPSSSLSPCSEAQVTQFIRQFVASCLLVSDSNTELSYVLPSDAVKKGCFERLFQVHIHGHTQKPPILFMVFCC